VGACTRASVEYHSDPRIYANIRECSRIIHEEKISADEWILYRRSIAVGRTIELVAGSGAAL
jgi:hypothetical protein